MKEQEEVHVTAAATKGLFDMANDKVIIERKRIKLDDCQINKLPTVEEVYEKDLPICSNVHKIHIPHYLMSLKFDFERKVVDGILLIFPLRVADNVKEIVLDSCSLDIRKVSSVSLDLKDLPRTNLDELYSSVTQSVSVENLDFTVDKWSLSIKLPSLIFPTAIKIEYETLPSSPSIQWRPCKGFTTLNYSSDPICCFTPAAPVNNRGLFPSQEDPSAMGTWECFVIADNKYSAFLSSDQPAVIVETNDQLTISYFNCSETMPMSTFAFIVSQISPANIIEIKPSKKLSNNHQDKCCCGTDKMSENGKHDDVDEDDEFSFIPTRIIFQNDSDFDICKLSSFIIRLLRASYTVLGQIPFQRLDIILMPDCFPTLGLCNPNMIFLSPSVLSGQNPLIYSRLTHEISHYQFGLQIGAADWTEEWLSEGFATFMEDIFHRMILEQIKMTATTSIEMKELDEAVQELKLKPCVRLVTLQDELENTNNEELQLLQPNQHHNMETPKHVMNGLEPMKQFMQVHYLKGYFFLLHLSNLVGGETVFLKFLYSYVQKFKGKLVTSADFVNFFKEYFCAITAKSSSILEWLQNASLPEPYRSANLCQPTLILTNQVQLLFPQCIEQLMKINNLTLWFNCHVTDNLLFVDSGGDIHLNATEKIIYLQQVLASTPTQDLSKNEKKNIFGFLEKLIHPTFENPEIQHRWCEIIIKFQYLPLIKTLKHYLLLNPAMGTYLYAEMIISERRQFQKLARMIYETQKNIMDPPCIHVLKQIIF